jgi:hypothetical protein
MLVPPVSHIGWFVFYRRKEEGDIAYLMISEVFKTLEICTNGAERDDSFTKRAFYKLEFEKAVTSIRRSFTIHVL